MPLRSDLRRARPNCCAARRYSDPHRRPPRVRRRSTPPTPKRCAPRRRPFRTTPTSPTSPPRRCSTSIPGISTKPTGPRRRGRRRSSPCSRVRSPRRLHPGLCHHYIHAVEASLHPERALGAAERLRDACPARDTSCTCRRTSSSGVGRYADSAARQRARRRRRRRLPAAGRQLPDLSDVRRPQPSVPLVRGADGGPERRRLCRGARHRGAAAARDAARDAGLRRLARLSGVDAGALRSLAGCPRRTVAAGRIRLCLGGGAHRARHRPGAARQPRRGRQGERRSRAQLCFCCRPRRCRDSTRLRRSSGIARGRCGRRVCAQRAAIGTRAIAKLTAAVATRGRTALRRADRLVFPGPPRPWVRCCSKRAGTQPRRRSSAPTSGAIPRTAGRSPASPPRCADRGRRTRPPLSIVVWRSPGRAPISILDRLAAPQERRDAAGTAQASRAAEYGVRSSAGASPRRLAATRSALAGASRMPWRWWPVE